MRENNIQLMLQLFRRIKHGVHRKHREMMDAYGIRGISCVYLGALSRKFPEGGTQKELSEAVHMDKAHTSRVIAALEEKGCVERMNESAVLNYKIRLTDKGREMAEVCEREMKVIEDKLSSVITEEEAEVLTEILKKLVKAAEEL